MIASPLTFSYSQSYSSFSKCLKTSFAALEFFWFGLFFPEPDAVWVPVTLSSYVHLTFDADSCAARNGVGRGGRQVRLGAEDAECASESVRPWR